MTITAREILESQHLAQDAAIIRGQRVFVVADITSGVLQPISAVNALSAAGLPAIGDGFAPGLDGVFCITRRLQHQGGIQQYEIVCDYESDPLFLDPDLTTSIEQADVWRIFVVPLPSPGFYTDIGGIRIDDRGAPVQRYVRRVQFNLSKFYNATSIDGLPHADWRFLAGGLNEVAFHGMPAQSVLYLGATSRPMRAGRQIVTHGFLYDENFHAIQFPRRDQNGDIEMEVDIPTLTAHAKTVYWRQTSQKIVDFSPLEV